MDSLKKLSEIRKEAYLKYSKICVEAWNNKKLEADTVTSITKKAYAEYKEIEKRVEEIEDFMYMENLESSRPIEVQI